MVAVASSVDSDTTAVTPAALVARARAMIPTLQSRAREDALRGCVRPETIAEIDAAGFWRVLVPKRWGGLEMSPRVAAQLVDVLAYGDLSVGWISGIYASLAYHLAYFDERAQFDVWGENPGARMVSPYAPDGRATPVEAGYRLSGHWHYSSGSVYSHWAMLGGLVIRDGAPPQYRLFLIPRADYQVAAAWNVVGLEATASHDLIIKDAFVPEHRTLASHGLDHRCSPGLVHNTNAIYRIPYFQLGYRNLSTGQLGALEAMIDAFVQLNATRVNAAGQRMKQDPNAQFVVARAGSELDEMRAVLDRNFDRLEELAAAGALPSVHERLMFRFQSASVAQRCVELATVLFQAAGGGAIRRDLPFEMIFRNIIAGRAHIGNDYFDLGRRMGAVRLGEDLPARDSQL